MLKGGCFCGKIRYEVTDDGFDATVCHCVDCRRASAAPMVAWFSAKRTAWRIVCGEPKRFASNSSVSRVFCGDCGTQLTWQSDAFPDDIDISICSLDAPDLVTPKHHTWTSQQLGWLHLDDALPRHPYADTDTDDAT